MNAETEMARIIEALRNGDRGAADDHAKGLVSWLDDNGVVMLEGYPEAWADLLAAVDTGHLEYCPQVGRLLDVLDDPDGVTQAICSDCRTFYYNGCVDDPESGWNRKLAGAWFEQWQFVHEKRVEEIWTAPCAACRNLNAGKRYVWRVDAVVGVADSALADIDEDAGGAAPSPDAPGMRGYTDEGDGFFSRPGADGQVVFVMGLLAPSADPDIEGDELHIAVAGFYRATRAEAMMSLAEQFREYAGELEAKATADT